MILFYERLFIGPLISTTPYRYAEEVHITEEREAWARRFSIATDLFGCATESKGKLEEFMAEVRDLVQKSGAIHIIPELCDAEGRAFAESIPEYRQREIEIPLDKKK